jgi:hypothetical protein
MSDKEEKPKTDAELYQFWNKEFAAAKKNTQKWHKEAKKTVQRFLDDRKGDQDDFPDSCSRLNLFHANIVTLMSMLYGRIPRVDVGRRFADAEDDPARVAGEILSRMLNTDIEEAGEDIASVFRNCLQDRLIPGLGNARVKYEFEEGEGDTPKNEWVDIVYTYWKDTLWSPSRTYAELRWKAFLSYMTKEQVKKRFPDADLNKINFNSKGPMVKGRYDAEEDTTPQAEIWEIWDKIKLEVSYYTEGYEEMLEVGEDPLQLEGFWPDPPPMIANLTTSKYMPRSDYAMAQDLYIEIDELETRITMLTRACKVVGVYDKQNEGVQRMFIEGVENDLIPVDNWAMFSEKNGLAGTVQWLPLADIVNAVDTLTQKQSEKIQKLYQITGMNDVMRGAAMQAGSPVSATERQLQANYGSIRIEALQNEFARWVSDLQGLKAEIIAKHFDPYCIKQQSNIMATPDSVIADDAIALIKSPGASRWRITVRPETLAIADYAQLKQERTEYIMGISQFLQSAAPMLEQKPEAAPFMMKLMKWGMAGFRGSSEIEGIMDQAISAMEKQPPQEKPDPAAQKAQAEAQKMQAEMQMKQQEHQAKMQADQQKMQNEMQLAQQKMSMEMQKLQAELQFMREKFALELQMRQAELGIKVQEKQVEAEANQQEQEAQFVFNTAEREHEAKVSAESGDIELRRDKERAKLKEKGNADNGRPS